MPFTGKEVWDNAWAEYDARQAKPAIDRQSLEKSLAYYEGLFDRNGRNAYDRLLTDVVDAARKHLDTLPKPVWHVTGRKCDGTPAAGAWLVEHTNALDTARSWLRCGWTNVSVKQGYRA